MPGRNLEKVYIDDSFYHIYNRGVEKRDIFLDNEDYRVFLSLLKRYLSAETKEDFRGREYPNYSKDIALIAYCLMPNHFHLLIWANKAASMTKLLRSIITSYGMYFNKKYKRVGKLFQERFRAVLVKRDEQLWHISRYIHLNSLDIGRKFDEYEFSSYKYFAKKANAEWIKPEKILEMFEEANQNYREFLEDYIDYKRLLRTVDTADH